MRTPPSSSTPARHRRRTRSPPATPRPVRWRRRGSWSSTASRLEGGRRQGARGVPRGSRAEHRPRARRRRDQARLGPCQGGRKGGPGPRLRRDEEAASRLGRRAVRPARRVGRPRRLPCARRGRRGRRRRSRLRDPEAGDVGERRADHARDRRGARGRSGRDADFRRHRRLGPARRRARPCAPPSRCSTARTDRAQAS